MLTVGKRFAWLPRLDTNGKIIWLRHFHCVFQTIYREKVSYDGITMRCVPAYRVWYNCKTHAEALDKVRQLKETL